MINPYLLLDKMKLNFFTTCKSKPGQAKRVNNRLRIQAHIFIHEYTLTMNIEHEHHQTIQ